MTQQTITPAIMIGGAGTRLWPLSRGNKPKQFLALVTDRSLFQDTVLRFDDAGFSKPWLLANADTLHHAQAQLRAIGHEAAGLVVEPTMRGTAAALIAVALVIARTDPEALILASPADHVIERPDLFRQAVQRALPIAADGAIVTFGIVPTAPETGFGYIRGDAPIFDGDAVAGFRVGPGGFLEKPVREKAEAFIKDGYFWNAGIFLFKASTLIAEFELHAGETLAAVRRAVDKGDHEAANGVDVWSPASASFAEAPGDLSIDNAVMEVTDKMAVVPCDSIRWSDVGSLSALWDIASEDERADVVHGDVLCIETAGNLVYGYGGRKVVLAHLSNIVVIDTDDCVLVLPRDHTQAVKTIVKHLKETESPEVNYTREWLAEWGVVRTASRSRTHLCVDVEITGATAIGPRRVSQDTETWVVLDGEIALSDRIVAAGECLVLHRGDEIDLRAGRSGARCTVVMRGSSDVPLGDLFRPLLRDEAQRQTALQPRRTGDEHRPASIAVGM